MFDRRARRACLLALVVGTLTAVPLWMRAGSAPGSAPVPLLDAPPLFAAAGQARDVTALVPGNAERVTLVVSSDGGPTLRYPMRQGEGQAWVGTIPPAALSGSEVSYAVAAERGGATSSSDEARLFVLDEVTASTPRASQGDGTPLVSLELGSAEHEFGVRGGQESARELPPSFAVDVAAKRIVVLDAVKQRIVTFGYDGKQLGRTPLDTSTSSDVVVDPSTSDVFVLDQAGDSLTRMSAKGRQTFPAIGVRNQPFGARLAYDARERAAYVRDVTQGRHVPVVVRGQRTTGAERASKARAGSPTPAGDLAVEVAGRSVTFGLVGSNARGFEVAFEHEVLDAGEAVVDGEGVIWSLVGLYDRQADAASLAMVRVDPSDASASMTTVDPSVPGDVTRRLAPAARGVVLLEGDDQALRLVGFEELSGGSK